MPVLWRGLTALLLLSLPQEAARIAPEEYDRRRTTLMERLPGAAVALESVPIRGVEEGGHAAERDFKYLTGYNDPGAILVLLDGKAVVFTDDPAKGVGDVIEKKSFGSWAEEHFGDRRKIFARLGEENLKVLRKAAPAAQIEEGKFPREIAGLRSIKSESELRLLRKATAATGKAHAAVMKALRPGMNEGEIRDLVLETFRKEGCPETGFRPICGAGKNGTILHYMADNGLIPADTLLVCDIGAAADGYTSDVTRTLPTSGKFSRKQREAYECVLDALKAAEKALKPGASCADLDKAARKVFEDRGMRKWSYAHAKDPSILHSIGHPVGLFAHDSWIRFSKLQPGMVFALEPGWYDKIAGWGIRIEDLYVVTADGCERLSSDVPREADEIEKIMSERKED